MQSEIDQKKREYNPAVCYSFSWYLRLFNDLCDLVCRAPVQIDTKELNYMKVVLMAETLSKDRGVPDWLSREFTALYLKTLRELQAALNKK